jgi:subtilisin family serine protease
MVNGVSGELDADIDYPAAMAYASGKLNNTVIVAVLDTGIMYDHSDLRANLWDGTNCKSDTGATLGGCKYGYDFAYNDKDPSDIYGHGTHVAGTIGAVTNNGTGMVGVTPNVKIMAVKVLNDGGGGSTASIIRGINFAKHNGAKVINASLGMQYNVSTVRDYDYLTYNAIQSFSGMFVAAAGNNGSNNDVDTVFPAGFGTSILVSGEEIIDSELVLTGSVVIPGLANMISVAASDSQDQLSYFSNYGTSVDIAAPGVSIYSTYPITEVVSGETEVIAYDHGWTKQASVSGEAWAKRANMVVSGEA